MSQVELFYARDSTALNSNRYFLEINNRGLTEAQLGSEIGITQTRKKFRKNLSFSINGT